MRNSKSDVTRINWRRLVYRLILAVPLTWLFITFTGLSYPLHVAVEADNYFMVNILSRVGFVDQTRGFFELGGCETPLQVAIRKGNRRIVDILLDNGADISFKGCSGRFPSSHYILTAAASDPELIEHLVKDRHINVNGDPSVLFPTLYCGMDTSNKGVTDIEGNSMSDIDEQRLKSLKILLDAGANPNVTATKLLPFPPLTQAGIQGCPESARLLLKHGADPVAAESALHKYFENAKPYFYFQLPAKARLAGMKESIQIIKRAAGK